MLRDANFLASHVGPFLAIKSCKEFQLPDPWKKVIVINYPLAICVFYFQ